MTKKLIGLFIPFLFLAFSGMAGEKTVTAGKWSFTYDTESGFWKEMKWDGVPVSVNPGNLAPFFWGPEWPTGKPEVKPGLFRYLDTLIPEEYGKIPQKAESIRLSGHRWSVSGSTLTLEYEIGKYKVADILNFGTGTDPDLFRRTWELSLRPGAEQSFFFTSPQLNMPVVPAGNYFFPGQLRYPDNVTVKPVAGLGANGRAEGPGYSTLPMLLEQNGLCAILFGDPLKDKSDMQIVRTGGYAMVQYNFKSYGILEPGEKQVIGPAYFKPARKTLREQMTKGIRELYRTVGFSVPGNRPEWLRDAVIFNASVGGSSYSKPLTLGGFHAARKELLPRVRALGFNTVWFRPVGEVMPYHPRDYFKVNPDYGTAEEYRELVRAAHDSGMRVVQGIVPHGTNAASGAVRGNSPEALIVDKKGEIPRYMAFDYMSPEWQAYMKKVAVFFAADYGADALRIDLADGSYPNWRKRDSFQNGLVPANVPAEWWKAELKKRNGRLAPLPYSRASLPRRQGGLEMSRAIREGLRSVKPEGAVLGEVQYAPYMTENDVIYDKELCHYFLRGVSWCNSLAKDSKVNWVQSLSHRLEQQEYVEPEHTLRLRFTETHDYTKTVQIVGVNAARAATAMNFILDGVPMVLQDFDEGNGEFLRRLIAARMGLPELRRGGTVYLHGRITPRDVFGCLRTMGDKSSLCLINFTAYPRNVRVRLPDGIAFAGGVFLDAFTGEKLPAEITTEVRMAPYEAKILALRSADESLPFVKPVPEPAKTEPAEGEVRFERNQWGSPVITTSVYSLGISNVTGMLSRFTGKNGEILLDESRFLKPERTLLGAPSQPSVRWNGRERKTSFGWTLSGVAVLPDGERVSLNWNFYPDHAELETELLSDSGKNLDLALAFTRRNVRRYQVNTAEGLLDDEFRSRFGEGTPGNLNRYSWRIYGTPVIWQSDIQPLDFRRPLIGAFGKTGVFVGLKSPLTGHPVNVMLLDRVAGKPRWCAAFFYKDSQTREPAARLFPAHKFTVTLTPSDAPLVSANDNPPVKSGIASLRNLSYGWLVRAPGYEMELSRVGGSVLRWSAGKRRLLSGGSLVVQNGMWTQDSEYEASVRIRQDGKSLKMLFSGVFKNGSISHSAGKMQTPPLRFYVLYTFGESSRIRVDCGVQSEGKRTEKELSVGWRAAGGKRFALKPLGKENWKSANVKDSVLWTVPGLSAATLSDGKWHHFSFQLEPHP